MRQLFLNKGNLVVKEVAQPLLHDYAIVVSVQYAYLFHGSNIEHADKPEGFFNSLPHKVKRALETVARQSVSFSQNESHHNTQVYRGLSYSCSGYVISVGKKVTKFAPGDLVACFDPALSPHTDLICILEQYAAKITHKEHLMGASLTALATQGLTILRKASLQLGETVAILGLNIIGLLTIQLAKHAGYKVIAIDTEKMYCDLAYKMKADVVLNYADRGLGVEVDLLTERYGVDAALVLSDKGEYVSTAIEITRKKGSIVFAYPHQSQLDSLVWQKNITIFPLNETAEEDISMASFTDKRWTYSRNMDICLQMIEGGLLDTSHFIGEAISFKQISDTYAKIMKNFSIGTVVSYGALSVQAYDHIGIDNASRVYTVPSVQCEPNKRGTVRIGFLGIGAFSSHTMLPILSQIKDVSLDAIVDHDLHKVIPLAKKYAISQTSFTDADLLQNPSIDLVIIGSSHTAHTDQALQALQAGKAVLLEKPIATDFSQLQRITSFLSKNRTAPFGVNYGFPFAPFIKKIKKEIVKRKTPLIALYRINRELARKEYPMHPEMGAGRIIGEVCQIVDLFFHLTEAQPISISVEAMHSKRDDIFPTDNVSTQMSFNDGSVCSIVYTTLGHPDMGSDRLEICYDGKSIVIDDFMELYGFGFSSWFNETVTKADFGHDAGIRHFIGKLMDGKSHEIDVSRIHMVAYVTLLIDQLACEGGGKKEL